MSIQVASFPGLVHSSLPVRNSCRRSGLVPNLMRVIDVFLCHQITSHHFVAPDKLLSSPSTASIKSLINRVSLPINYGIMNYKLTWVAVLGRNPTLFYYVIRLCYVSIVAQNFIEGGGRSCCIDVRVLDKCTVVLRYKWSIRAVPLKSPQTTLPIIKYHNGWSRAH